MAAPTETLEKTAPASTSGGASPHGNRVDGSGRRKAAILLRSLSASQRAVLLAKLDVVQSSAVAAEMNRLETVAGAEQEAVVREFTELRTHRPDRSPPPPALPFDFLGDLEADELLELLEDEHPRTISLVLCYVPPRTAAEVLARLTSDQQFAVVCRIATMREPGPKILRDVESVLRKRLQGEPIKAPLDCGLASAVKILGAMDPVAERQLLGSLAEADPRLLREIRRAMFGPDVAAHADLDPVRAVS
jgi:flagellar motor switch protein FliG